MSFCGTILTIQDFVEAKRLQSWKLCHEAKDGQSDEHSEVLAEGLPQGLL